MFLFCARGIIVTRHVGDGQVTGSKLSNYRVIRQNDTANTTETTAKILTGWGFIAPGGSANHKAETVTFAEAFQTPPIVIVGNLGEGTGPGINNQTGASGSFMQVTAVSTNSFDARVLSRDTTNLSAAVGFGYSWIAIGS